MGKHAKNPVSSFITAMNATTMCDGSDCDSLCDGWQLDYEWLSDELYQEEPTFVEEMTR